LKEEFVSWHSPSLGWQMDMLVFGHAGIPLLTFPTSMGRYHQNKDFLLIDSIAWYVDNGLVKVYCPDSVDEYSWYNKSIHPADRVRTHMAYDRYIREEVYPKMLEETGISRIATAGCSFGAYHATNFAFRYPELVAWCFNMGGAFDIKMQLDGFYNDDIYFHNPMDFVEHATHHDLWKMGIVLGVGEHDFCRSSNEKLHHILHHKGIDAWLDITPGGIHDWPAWRDMFPRYISKINF
jgi:esterase/lipase superfamily enzyme